jgi:phosphoribosylaminoimidazole-succinocarboxamide synthase
MSVVTYTDLPFKVFKKGKVRDVYEVDNNLLLIVTDRISAFDYVLEDPIPYKGVCLTQISKFWFDFFKDTVPSHVVSADVADFPSELREHEDVLSGRSMLVKKAEVFPIECIVRGYISGSADIFLAQHGNPIRKMRRYVIVSSQVDLRSLINLMSRFLPRLPRLKRGMISIFLLRR